MNKTLNYPTKISSVSEANLNLHKLNLYLLENKIIYKSQYNFLEKTNYKKQHFKFFTTIESEYVQLQNVFMLLMIPQYFNEIILSKYKQYLKLILSTYDFFNMCNEEYYERY